LNKDLKQFNTKVNDTIERHPDWDPNETYAFKNLPILIS